jgi:hypothetical protein
MHGGRGGGGTWYAAVVLGPLLGGCHTIVGFGELPPPDPVTRFTTCAARARDADPAFDIKLGLTFVENAGGPATSGLQVRACLHRNDAPLTCETPLSETASPDAGGRVELVISTEQSLPGSFVPYVRVEKSDAYFPTSIFTVPEVRRDVELPPLIAIGQGVVDGLTSYLAVDRAEVIDRRGHLVVVVIGCDGLPAERVRVSIGEGLRDAQTLAFARGSDMGVDPGEEVTKDDGVLVYLGLPMADDVARVPLQLYDEASEGRALFPQPIEVPVRRGEATMVLVDPTLG